MTTKHDVIRAHREHPDWCSTEIARELGCHSAYVRATAYRNGLTLPDKRGMNGGRPCGPRRWTPELLDELRAVYSVPSTRTIAALFGISPHGLKRIASRNRIPRFTDGGTD